MSKKEIYSHYISMVTSLLSMATILIRHLNLWEGLSALKSHISCKPVFAHDIKDIAMFLFCKINVQTSAMPRTSKDYLVFIRETGPRWTSLTLKSDRTDLLTKVLDWTCLFYYWLDLEKSIRAVSWINALGFFCPVLMVWTKGLPLLLASLCCKRCAGGLSYESLCRTFALVKESLDYF